MKRLFIEPNDVLIFRDGRSFSAGADHLAMGVFPPAPTPFYGAIRSAMLSQQGIAIADFKKGQIPDLTRKEIGTPRENGQMTLSFFAVARRSGNPLELLYPCPADVLKVKDCDQYTRISSRAMPFEVKTNGPGRFLWSPDIQEDQILEEARGYLNPAGFQRYLECGDISKIDFIYHHNLYVKEPRTGIRIRSDRHTTGEGQLFSVEFSRLNQGVGFAVQVDPATCLQDHGLLRLGGEARSAAYSSVPFSLPERKKVEEMVRKTGRFRLILLTPAIFQAGWLPDGIAGDHTGHIGEVPVKLIGAAIRRSHHLGGWDLVENRPKPARRAVPAGSVYFFEIVGGNVVSLFDACFLKSFTGSQEGLALSVIGGVEDVH